MKKYYLSVCCIVRNEANYISEFLEFHLLQGVEHFYIYEHESDDNTWEILRRYEALGIVTLNKVKGKKAQNKAYKDCLRNYGSESQWVAFIDADEFLHRTHLEPLPELLKTFEDAGALAVQLMLYGSNGKKEYELGLVIERFTRRAAGPNEHVKSICQPHLTIGIGKNPHYFLLRMPAVNERGELQPEQYHVSQNPSCNLIRVSHFHNKSLGEYLKRKPADRADVDGVFRPALEGFPAHDANDVEEKFDEDFIEKLKANLADRHIFGSVKK